MLNNVLFIVALVIQAFPGYGCRQAGDLEVCMTQLNSTSLREIFPNRVVDTSEWCRYMVSIKTADESVAAFLVRIVYATEQLESDEQIALVARGANGGNAWWTNALFFTPLNSTFKSVTVLPLKPAQVLTLSSEANQ